MKKIGTLFILVGPSRVGKDSVLRGLLKMKSLRLKKLVTVTTRAKRPREIRGKTYHYVTENKFSEMISQKKFLEWAPVRNYRFGTPREPLLTWLSRGQDVIQQVDVRGADVLRRLKELPHVVTIFILPGSMNDLKQRLNNGAFKPGERRIRWQETLQELQKQAEYDYRVVNPAGKLAQTIKEVAEIIAAQKH